MGVQDRKNEYADPRNRVIKLTSLTWSVHAQAEATISSRSSHSLIPSSSSPKLSPENLGKGGSWWASMDSDKGSNMLLIPPSLEVGVVVGVTRTSVSTAAVVVVVLLESGTGLNRRQQQW